MNFASTALRCLLCCFLMASAAVAADARFSGGPAAGTPKAADPPAVPSSAVVGVQRPPPVPASSATNLPVVTTLPTIVTPPTGVAVIGPAGTTAGANVSNQLHSLTQGPSSSAGGPPPATGPVVIAPAAPSPP